MSGVCILQKRQRVDKSRFGVLPKLCIFLKILCACVTCSFIVSVLNTKYASRKQEYALIVQKARNFVIVQLKASGIAEADADKLRETLIYLMGSMSWSKGISCVELIDIAIATFWLSNMVFYISIYVIRDVLSACVLGEQIPSYH